MKNHLIEGPILKALLTLAVPITIANILHSTYQVIDMFWVGRLGAEAVAAISLSFPLFFFLISLGMGLTMAGTILVAQYKGKNEQNNVDYVSAQTFILVFSAALLITIVGYFFSPYFIKLMNVEQVVFDNAVSYLRIMFFGIIFLFGYFVFQNLLRGIGDVKTPMYIVAGTVLLNLVLDPIFILGYGPFPMMGVKGAAFATVISQFLATLIGLVILFTGRYDIHLKRKNFRLDVPLIKKMFRLGFPSSLEQSTRSLGFVFMTFLAAGFGTSIIAAYGIGGRFMTFVIIPALGLSMATSTLVGQNIGAGKIERAIKVSNFSSLLTFLVFTFIGIIFFIFAKQLSSIFIPNNPDVISISTSFVRITALSFGFLGFHTILNGTFRGSGNTLMPMVLAILSLWVLRLPLAYFLSHFTSLSHSGLWWAFPISNILAALAALGWYLKGSWKEKRVTEEIALQEDVTEEVIIEKDLQ